jgi:Xaa-Pro aminopeptidase
MVVTVEPGLYFPGWGGIRIEDDLVVTEGRPLLLADLEKDHLLSLPA